MSEEVSPGIEILEMPTAPSTERKREIVDEVGKTAKLMNGWGKDWYLVGGLALELRSEEIRRDHVNDIDLAVNKKDVLSLIEYFSNKDVVFVKPLRPQEFKAFKDDLGPDVKISYENKDTGVKHVETTNPDVILSGGNFFIVGADLGSDNEKSIDVDILEQDEDDNYIFHPDKNIRFPKSIYENAHLHCTQRRNGSTSFNTRTVYT